MQTIKTAYGQWIICESPDGHLEVVVVGAGSPTIHITGNRCSVELRLPANRKKQRLIPSERAALELLQEGHTVRGYTVDDIQRLEKFSKGENHESA